MASKNQQHGGGQSKERMADIGRKGGQHSHDKDNKRSPSRSGDQDTSHSSGRSSQDNDDRHGGNTER